MTGFGSAEGKVLGGRLSIEIRSVNHRYFNPQLKLPFELGAVEGPLRERLRQLLERGHVTVSARWVEAPQREAAVAVDLARARQLVAAAKELKKRLKLKGEVDLAFVARQPDVLNAHQDGSAPAQWSEVEPIAERAVQELLGMRAREGAALAAELGGRLGALEQEAGTIEQRAPERLTAELARLKKAVAELAAGVQIDEQRLAVEVALMADRVDITEELVRLRTHLAACRTALASDGAVGKQLGFLAQELLREVNTIGSKANDAGIARTVIAMKGELEKLREQLDNLEWRPPRAWSYSPPRPGAARRPSRASCGLGLPTASGTRCPPPHARRGRASGTVRRIIFSRGTSSSGGVRRESSSSRPSMRGSCTARCAARSSGYCAAGSMWCSMSK